ncbi:AP2 domain-containing protein [Edaphobacter aggregans]|nr:AP2 domain-containing protein [Edaphobacter aggregans]
MSSVLVKNDEAVLVITGKLGQFHVLIDLEDVDRVAEHNWHAHKERNGTVYFRANVYRTGGKQSAILLHRFLMNPPDSMTVFHRTPDTLDCRKSNLLVGTKEQAAWKKCTPRQNSRYKGVSGIDPWHTKQWAAHIRVNGVMKWLGRHMTEIEAAKAYDKVAKELHGEYAYLNFPET